MSNIRNNPSRIENSSVLSTEIAYALRAFNPSAAKPSTLDELWSLMGPIRTAIPELIHYDLTTTDGKREFPRTAASLAIFGCMLRASDALNILDRPVIEANRRMAAVESLLSEFTAFSAPQDEPTRISFDQFKDVVRLFQGTTGDVDAIATMAIAVTYGDLCKMPAVKETLKRLIKGDVADHDIALQEAFHPNNITKCAELFPTMFKLPLEYQRRIHGEVLSGLNLGHVLQVETGPSALTPLKLQTSHDPDGLTHWLLPTLLDIFGARADASRPETWGGSALANANLVPAILIFAAQLPELSRSGEISFFDTFQKKLSERPFYAEIFADGTLSERHQDTLFRLARYLSWETDTRPLHALIDAFKERSAEEQELLATYFLTTGFTPGMPKTVVTYLPYVFTQMYAKHLELPEAISKTLDTMCSLLSRINELQRSTVDSTSMGIRTYSAQNVWFNALRTMTKTEVSGAPIRLALAESMEGTPEVILEPSILVRNPPMRATMLRCLQSATELALPYCSEILDRELSPLERQVLAFVNSHNFQDGAWYRPIHNVVVPYAMIQICKQEGASRDLVIAAMLHDIGYAGLKIPGTLQGAAWDAKDIRETHMAASAVMSDTYLSHLIRQGSLSMSFERKQHLVNIIATHDDPYIGRALSNGEALAHRDADRTFVISAVSFWKDYIAYLSDENHCTRFKQENIELTPQAFLELRMGSFNNRDGNRMARFTRFEPMTSKTGLYMSEAQYARRRGEIALVSGAIRAGEKSERELTSLLVKIIIDDFRSLHRA